MNYQAKVQLKEQIKRGYIECMLFADKPTDDQDQTIDFDGLSTKINNRIDVDIYSFIKKADNLIAKALEKDQYFLENIGHDFWLTRNGHGVGFWDRDLGEVGEKLTKIAESFGTAHLYVFKNQLYSD